MDVERGSGNVFEDVGFSPGRTQHLQLRAQLMSTIRAEARGMTHAQVARRFGVTPPRMNDLLRGKIDQFSLDALVILLASAGLRVEMRVKKAAEGTLHEGFDEATRSWRPIVHVAGVVKLASAPPRERSRP